MDVIVSEVRVLDQFYPLPAAISSSTKHALVLLNHSNELDERYVNLLLENTVWFAAVDGAANWVRKHTLVYKNAAGFAFPDVISGDFDSVDKETLEYFSQYPVRIVHTENQDKTDLVKCLEILSRDVQALAKFQRIIVLPSLHGRLDHVFGNINALFLARNLIPEKPLFLLSGGAENEQSICLLGKGKTRLNIGGHIPAGNSCGLVPINGRCENVTTRGLCWNVEKLPMCFGGLVSTSNRLAGDLEYVEVESDNDLLWILQLGRVPLFSRKVANGLYI